MSPAGTGARLTQGSISRNILSLMLPMMLGMVAILANNLASAFFLARISTAHLAAVSFTFPISFIIGAVALGLGTGTSAVTSRLFGAGRREEVRRIAGHGILLGIVCAILMSVAGLLSIKPVFRLLGADGAVLAHIDAYMRIYYWGGVFLVAPMIANAVLRASGDARRPAMIMTASAVLNIIVSPLLIFGLFGLPRMEIEGAALGSVIANALTLCTASYFVMYRERLVNLRNFEFALIGDSWRRILHVGLPTLASGMAMPVTTAFITSQVARFGQDAVAGFGMAGRVEGLMTLVLMALSTAMTPFAGQNMGAGQLGRVREGMHFASRFSVVYGIGIAVVVFFAADTLTRAFGLTPGARDAAMLHLQIVPASYLALGCSMAVSGTLNAMNHPVAAMLVSLCRSVVIYAPLAWLLSHFFGLTGIFIAAATANFLAGGIGIGWFRLIFRETLADQPTAQGS